MGAGALCGVDPTANKQTHTTNSTTFAILLAGGNNLFVD